MLNLKKLVDLCRRGEVDTVVMVFPDMLGRLMGKRITGAFFADEAASHGTHACAYLLTVDMEMDPVQGFELTSWEKGYGDFHLVPDYSTARLLPWLEKTALVLCDLESEAGAEVEVSPRAILKRQVARAAAKGLRFMVGSELELYLYKDGYEEARAKGYHRLEQVGKYIEDYHILQGTKEEFVVREIRNQLEAAGVPIEGSKGEWGFGQQEINLRPAEPLEMADRHVVYKHGAKEIAIQKGVSATFMAKPDAAQAGSSFHLHASLWDRAMKKNQLWDAKAHGPSKAFSQVLAGSLALARDFSLFFAPTVNSYKRYVASSFAPTRLAWGRDNRTCGFRVVGHEGSFRLENRIPGADANPYLAYAATIAAFLHGIENGLKAPAEFRGDAYHSKGLSEVPKSLGAALGCWERSSAAKAAFGEAVHSHYLHAGRWELASFEKAVTNWELNRYFERI
ncbi:MAG: glutamine synthetase [Elusimicrobia bacterium]|nr:glutamine synthetase [Elusimicrobiota bacterium]